jgi:hypothetical protein
MPRRNKREGDDVRTLFVVMIPLDSLDATVKPVLLSDWTAASGTGDESRWN